MRSSCGRSTRSLDRMNTQKWIACALLASWALQMSHFWYVPTDVAEEIAQHLSTKPSAAAVTELANGLWLSWVLHVLCICLGIAAAVAMLRDSWRWRVLNLLAAIAYIVIFNIYFWLPTWFGPLLALGDRAASRGLWLWDRPRLVFDVLVFPALLVAAVIYAAVTLRRRGARRDAI